jgi:hypothetical protein
MNQLSQRLAILAILVAAPVAGEAATYSVTPVFVGAFTNDGTLTPIPGYSTFSSQAVVLQFDFVISVAGMGAPEAGYAGGYFTIKAFNLTNTTKPGWFPSPIPNVDTNGAVPGGIAPVVAANADRGAQDLANIYVGIASPLTTNPAVDPRYRFAQSGPLENYNAGSVFFDFDGGIFFGMAVGFSEVYAFYQDGALQRYVAATDGDAIRPLAYVFQPLEFEFPRSLTPEPAAAVLVAIGMVCAAVRRA